MKNILVVIDMQKDFVDGSLGTKEAVEIIPAAVKEINDSKYDHIFVTYDTHTEDYMNTFEGNHLPVEHCIKGTSGWKLNEEIAEALKRKKFTSIEKPTFGSFGLVQEITALCPESITLIGLCTDICVISNALLLRAALYNTKISVISSACAGVTPESHEAALTVMRSNQIDVL